MCFACICCKCCCFSCCGTDVHNAAAHFSSVFVSLSFPRSFPSASAQSAVFSHSFGRDLITYLFGLSFSKLPWLCILLRTEMFPPSLLLSAFHPVSPSVPMTPPTDWYRSPCRWALVFTHLCYVVCLQLFSFLIILFYTAPFISSKAGLNSFQWPVIVSRGV